MQVEEHSATSLRLRMDDRKQRVVVAPEIGEGAALFGWEVADAPALEALAARLEAAGVGVRRGERALAEERRVKDVIVFADPIGTRLEAFHGPEISTEPFKPGRAISGFRTGPLGMGHAVLAVANADALLPFYRDVLGFRLSDWLVKPFTAYFFHVNPRHHSLALIESGKNDIHHFMVELYSLDDVGQGFDLAHSLEVPLGTTIGRHTNDLMTSFYSRTPSGFMVEYGWGGRAIDPGTSGCGWISRDARRRARCNCGRRPRGCVSPCRCWRATSPSLLACAHGGIRSSGGRSKGSAGGAPRSAPGRPRRNRDRPRECATDREMVGTPAARRGWR